MSRFTTCNTLVTIQWRSFYGLYRTCIFHISVISPFPLAEFCLDLAAMTSSEPVYTPGLAQTPVIPTLERDILGLEA